MAPAQKIQAYGLEETYIDLGEHTFKIVLNPRSFKSGQDCEVVLVDSDRQPMRFDVKKWGRKLNVTFQICPETPDGVSVASVTRGGKELARLSFWVVKP